MAEKPVRYFRLVPGAGSHAGPGRQDKTHHYDKREIVPSTDDLCALFPGKWQEVDKKGNSRREEVIVPADAVDALTLVEKVPAAEEVVEEDKGPPLGTDVTTKFHNTLKKSKRAEAIKVFKDEGGMYWVADIEAIEIPLNKEALSFNEAKKFIKTLED